MHRLFETNAGASCTWLGEVGGLSAIVAQNICGLYKEQDGVWLNNFMGHFKVNV
jgi:hypothetical protein